MLVERSFDEMVTFINNVIADMNIKRTHKLELGGMIVAIAYKYQNDLSTVAGDFKSYIDAQVYRTSGVYACRYCKNRTEYDEEYACGCDDTDCDGVSGWEYGSPRKKR